jgi:hypothetical protein
MLLDINALGSALYPVGLRLATFDAAIRDPAALLL